MKKNKVNKKEMFLYPQPTFKIRVMNFFRHLKWTLQGVYRKKK